MTVSGKKNGRTIIFIPVAKRPIEEGYWIYADTLQNVMGDNV